MSACKSAAITILILVACAVLSVIIPPLKSPDEHDHLERAYLLGKGVIIAERPEGKASGGNIDTGLSAYLNSFSPSQRKMTESELAAAREIPWSGKRAYDPSPGAAYYFPIIYLPQTSALLLGEHLGLTVDASYRLARAFTLLASALLVFSAFRIYPTNPLTLGLIAIPMSLFQLSSASLDGISTALAIFIIALFLRIAKEKGNAAPWLVYALAISITVLTTSRIHAAPVLLLLAACYWYTNDRKALYLLGSSTLFFAIWTAVAIKTTVDLRITTSAPVSEVVAFYLKHPLQFFKVLYASLSDDSLQDFYKKSFLGILGWLDTPFDSKFYRFLGLGIFSIAALSFSIREFRDEWRQRSLLIFIALAGTLLIFFALLVTWTPHPAGNIAGVQGRYFMIPAIFLAYGIAGNKVLFDGWRGKIAAAACLLFFILSLIETTKVLIARYYLISQDAAIERVVHVPDGPGSESSLVASKKMDEQNPVSVNFPIRNDIGKITKIGIRFGTHMRRNPGNAELVLKTAGGGTYHRVFSLPELIDNAYQYFSVPPDNYVTGEIRFLTGGGISTWESHAANGQVLTCLDLAGSNKNVVITGCPY
jgi:uncharacterized membrane protein